MVKRIVVALGGNAILKDNPSEKAQKEILKYTSVFLVNLIKYGHKIVITHGNGPQVGNLLLQQAASDSKENPAMSIDTCVGMTQGSIGYWLQNALVNEMAGSQIKKPVVSLVTQVVVNENDEGFVNPTKPIGPFLTKTEANERKLKNKYTYVEDAGRGYRRVVPSPKPIDIVEKDVIKQLIDKKMLVIVCGGGGIPVIKKPNNQYEGVECVIDKDLASEKLSELIDADIFVIVTDVKYIALNYNKPNQVNLKKVTVEELNHFKTEGHFASGSMLPKVNAVISFIENNPEKKAIITDVENLPDIFGEDPGTIILGKKRMMAENA